MPTFATAGEVLNDAAVEMALVDGDVPDIYASSNPALVQLRRLLKALGRDLARSYRWTHLHKTYSFVTTPGVDTYALPPDFQRLIDGTEWNRSQQMPLGGPLNPQDWQLYKAMASAGVVWLNFRIVANTLVLHPVPETVQALAYEYVSAWWVQDFPVPPPPATPGPLSPAPDTEVPDNLNEVLWFDARLLVAGLVLRFREAKGFDTRAAQRIYEDALAAAQGGDGAAPSLSLTGCGVKPYDKPITVWGPMGGTPAPVPPVPPSPFPVILEIGGLY